MLCFLVLAVAIQGALVSGQVVYNGTLACNAATRPVDITSTSFITSPGFDADNPVPYEPNQLCEYSLGNEVTNGGDSMIRFDSFNVRFSDGCTEDYVEIYDSTDTSGQARYRLCGSLSQNVYFVGNNPMFVRFVSGATPANSSFGFQAQVFESGNLPCTAPVLLGDPAGGEIVSHPGIETGLPYDNNMNCEWYIVLDDPTKSVVWNFSACAIEGGTCGPWDNLVITDVASNRIMMEVHGDVCQSDSNVAFENSGSVHLHWQTDSSITEGGWRMGYGYQ